MGSERPSTALHRAPLPNRQVLWPLAAYALAVAILDLGGLIPGPGDGPVGLAQVLAAHLTIVALLFVPFAFLRGAWTLRLALAVLAVAGLLRFGGEWWSPPGGTDGPTIEVATFNLEIMSRAAPEAAAFLRPMTADVIALQELTPEYADAIAADPLLADHYPYQALYPRGDVLGLGLLSRHPLSGVTFEGGPSRLVALADTPIGRIRVLDVHPLPAQIPRGPLGIPIGFDPTVRDAALGRIKETIAESTSADEPVLVLGDINTAPTEPAFARFTSGLLDAHAEVGVGPGWTYRPSRLEALGIGLIRIDVVLMSAGLRPVADATRCPPIGDHCAVITTVGVRE